MFSLSQFYISVLSMEAIFSFFFVGDGDCDLTCRADRYGFYNTFPEHAQNGALCNANQGSVCLEGVCTVSYYSNRDCHTATLSNVCRH